MRPVVLDCTLRDGGYVNNWGFDYETALAIMDGLYESGVRYIEIGILGENTKVGKQTKFSSFDEIVPLLKHRKPDCHYAVMLTQDMAGKIEFPVCNEKTPDCIRLAFFAETWEESLEFASGLKDKGYQVFLQAMATFMYSDSELYKMLHAANELLPRAFYMVDSFSTMYPEDVREMRDKIFDRLSPEIAMGFHAHNNIQMAFANVQAFLECSTKRELFADCSIFGMGRGAGNVPSELLMDYLIQRKNMEYKIPVILKLFQNYLKPIYLQYGWGYTLPYYLTASMQVNPAYGWYFTNHGVEDLYELQMALEQIPAAMRHSLKAAEANEIIKGMQIKKNG